jgi:sec-independent protein translocase protein TatC
MQSNKMSAQLMSHINVALVLGFFAAFPYVFFEFWRFLKPALNRREVRHSRGAVFFASILFSLGACFGYYIISPLSMDFLGTYQVSEAVKNDFLLESYISTFISVVLASGVIFEMPILIYFLAKIGLVTSAFLKKYRKHAFVIILSVAAIITPPDIFSQILVTLPLMILYEISIMLAKRIERKERKLEAQNAV